MSSGKYPRLPFLALWYSTLFIAGSLVIVFLTYVLTAASLAQRDQQIINAKLGGQRLAQTPPLVQALTEEVPEPLQPAMAILATVLLETLVDRHEERIALAGTANLTRASMLDFTGSLRPVLEALEEEVILLKLIGEQSGSTRVSIGDENEYADLRATSIVSTGYGPGGQIVGGLGVLGPTRMDYPGTIATVRAVARYVGDLLAQN